VRLGIGERFIGRSRSSRPTSTPTAIPRPARLRRRRARRRSGVPRGAPGDAPLRVGRHRRLHGVHGHHPGPGVPLGPGRHRLDRAGVRPATRRRRSDQARGVDDQHPVDHRRGLGAGRGAPPGGDRPRRSRGEPGGSLGAVSAGRPHADADGPATATATATGLRLPEPGIPGARAVPADARTRGPPRRGPAARPVAARRGPCLVEAAAGRSQGRAVAHPDDPGGGCDGSPGVHAAPHDARPARMARSRVPGHLPGDRRDPERLPHPDDPDPAAPSAGAPRRGGAHRIRRTRATVRAWHG
jgi:hypothetical protein